MQRSAFLPTASSPMSSRPSAFAPFFVAISIMSQGESTVGSFARPLWMSEAICISSNMSRLSLEAGPSVPSATFTPSSIARAIRAKPLPSFMLLVGLWTSDTSRSAMMRKSSSVHHTQCAAYPPRSRIPVSAR